MKALLLKKLLGAGDYCVHGDSEFAYVGSTLSSKLIQYSRRTNKLRYSIGGEPREGTKVRAIWNKFMSVIGSGKMPYILDGNDHCSRPKDVYTVVDNKIVTMKAFPDDDVAWPNTTTCGTVMHVGEFSDSKEKMIEMHTKYCASSIKCVVDSIRSLTSDIDKRKGLLIGFLGFIEENGELSDKERECLDTLREERRSLT